MRSSGSGVLNAPPFLSAAPLNSLSQPAAQGPFAAHAQSAPWLRDIAPTLPTRLRDSPPPQRLSAVTAVPGETASLRLRNRSAPPAQTQGCSRRQNNRDGILEPPADIRLPDPDARPPPAPLPGHCCRLHPEDASAPPPQIPRSRPRGRSSPAASPQGYNAPRSRRDSSRYCAATTPPAKPSADRPAPDRNAPTAPAATGGTSHPWTGSRPSPAPEDDSDSSDSAPNCRRCSAG